MVVRRLVGSVAGHGTRQRALLSAAVDRFVAPLAGGPPSGLRRGRDVPRQDARVVLVVLVDVDRDAVDRLLAALRGVAERPRSATPVLVAHHRWWPLVRRAGLVVEQLFSEPVRQRDHLAELCRTYGTHEVLVVGPTSGTGDVVRQIAAGRSGPARPRRLARRLEAWADPPA